MSIITKIQWADATVNFWTGCRKVSQGCKFCYMFRDKERYGQDPTTVLRTSDGTFYQALKWKTPKLIFTCSWSDFFIPQADAWREEAWRVIRQTPHHRWQILTKRPERILQCLPGDWGEGYKNVWLGVSAEDQASLEQRLPLLQQTPAALRFLSCEPLLGDISFTKKDGTSLLQDIDWVIVGGESGNDKGQYRYRPCELDWIEGVVRQCTQQGVAVFVKQLGTHLARQLQLQDRTGGDMEEWAEALKRRDFPVKSVAAPTTGQPQLRQGTAGDARKA